MGRARGASPPPPPPPQVDAAPDVTTVLSLNNGGNAVCHAGHTHRLRVHECSICGAEFASGQALGGHMRRHRAHEQEGSTHGPVVAEREPGETRRGLLLGLDLNATPAEQAMDLSLWA